MKKLDVSKFRAFDITYDKDRKTYIGVNVEYNIETNEAYVIDTVELDTQKHMAIMMMNQIMANKAANLTTLATKKAKK